MSFLKSFFTSSHRDHAAAAPSPAARRPSAKPPAAPTAKAHGPRLLVTGDSLDCLTTRTEIAGRTIVAARTAENAAALLAAEPFDGVMAGFQDAQSSVSLLDGARASKPAIACALCADTGELGQVKHAYPVVSRTEQIEVLDDRLRTIFAASKLGSNPALFPGARVHPEISLAAVALHADHRRAATGGDAAQEDRDAHRT